MACTSGALTGADPPPSLGWAERRASFTRSTPTGKLGVGREGCKANAAFNGFAAHIPDTRLAAVKTDGRVNNVVADSVERAALGFTP